MPENGGFTFFAGAAGVFGVILGWALSLVGLGGKIQKTKGEIERAHTRLDAHDIKFTANDLVLAETTQTRIRILDYDRRLSEIENAIKSVLKHVMNALMRRWQQVLKGLADLRVRLKR